MKPKGILVTFEGTEGSGKSTQMRALARHYSSHLRILSTREPGGTSLGDAVRKILLKHHRVSVDPRAELFLLEAARAQHVKEVLEPALKSYDLVLCDRFTDSSLAYQGGGRGISMQKIRELNDFATYGLRPDLTVLLTMNTKGSLRRMGKRSKPKDRFELEAIRFHENVRKCYLQLARRESRRFLVLDATKSARELTKQTIGRIDSLRKDRK